MYLSLSKDENLPDYVKPRVHFYRVQKSTDNKCQAVLTTQAEISTVLPSKAAFTNNDIYIPPKLATAHQLQPGDKVKLRAVLSFNKKRAQWSYQAVSLTQDLTDKATSKKGKEAG